MQLERQLGWRIGYGSLATVGAVIVSRRSFNVIGWILCAVGLTGAVAAVGTMASGCLGGSGQHGRAHRVWGVRAAAA
jgi:hypothetical protein